MPLSKNTAKNEDFCACSRNGIEKPQNKIAL